MHLPKAPLFALCILAMLAAVPVQAQDGLESTPNLDALVAFDQGQSHFRVAVERFRADLSVLHRRYDVPMSATRRDRLRSFYGDWLSALAASDFEALNHEGQVDYVLLRNRLDFNLEMLRQEEATREVMAPLMPFSKELEQLQIDRRDRLGVA
ncbi:MAG: hypothetical protein ACI9W4_002543, partial [Rhodothermales bacterium]